MDCTVVSIRVKFYSSEVDVFRRLFLCDFMAHIGSPTCSSVEYKTAVKIIKLQLSHGKNVKHLNLFIDLLLIS